MLTMVAPMGSRGAISIWEGGVILTWVLHYKIINCGMQRAMLR